MWRVILRTALLSGIAWTGLLAAGAAGAEPAKLAQVGAQLGPDTVAVLHLPLADLSWDQIQKQLAATEAQRQELEQQLARAKSLYERLIASGATDVFLLFAIAEENPSVVVACRSPEDPPAIRAVLAEPGWSWTAWGGAPKWRVAGPGNLVLSSPPPQPPADGARQEQLVQALSAGGEAAIRLAWVPTPAHRRVLAGATEPPGWPQKAVLDTLADVRWATLVLPWQRGSAVEAYLGAADAAQAQKLQKVLEQLAAQLQQAAPLPPPLAARLRDLLETVRIETAGDQVQVAFPNPGGSQTHPLIQLAVQAVLGGRPDGEANLAALWIAAHQAAARRNDIDHLKQIGLAIYNFEDSYGGLPPAASYDAGGRPLLSWRVFLLPYLDQNELYRQFHLDEPWDSPHNRQLIERIPEVYQGGGAPGAGKTPYLAVVGDDTLIAPRQGTTTKEITDGTSNTVMVISAPAKWAVEWTRPADWDVQDAERFEQLIKASAAPLYALFGDASVRSIEPGTDAEQWRAMITKSGGEKEQAP